MNGIDKHLKTPIILIILIFVSGCATREDFRRSFIAKHVKEGVYTNHVKGFKLIWPQNESWVFRDYPEFDLSFNHVDGRSQILIIGVNRLIRRDFPDGFHQWMLDRLHAIESNQIERIDMPTDNVQKVRITAETEFDIGLGHSIGIFRITDTLFIRQNRQWVAMMGICPREYYDEKKPDFEVFFDSISML